MAIITSISGATHEQREAFRTKAGRFMRKNLGRPGNNWANWGLHGVRESFTEGAMSGLGFYKSAPNVAYGGMGPTLPGKYKFLGGGVNKRALMGLGVGAGVGAAVYAATDSPLLAAGAGLGAAWATKAKFKAMGGLGMKMLGPGFLAMGAWEGYKEGGAWGAAKGLGKGVAEWGVWNVGFKALSVAFKGSGIGAAGSGLAAIAAPLAAVAAIGYGVYKGAEYFAERGRKSMNTEFAGDTSAFTSQASYSMRQRAMQEISRSHTNSRTILGNEAQLMHF